MKSSTRSCRCLGARGFILASLLAALPFRLLAQTSTWISPGPAGAAVDWTDPAGWDNGTVPNSPDAVAIFNAFHSPPQSDLTTVVGTRGTSIVSPITLGELRYLPPSNVGVTLAAAGIEIGAGGQFRIEGPGITMTGELRNQMSGSILVRNGGMLEFANSASVTGPSLSLVTIIGGSSLNGDGPGSVVFRDQSSAGAARLIIPNGNTLKFLDQSSAGQALISVDGAITFSGNSTGGSSRIATTQTLVFENTSSAGSASLSILSNPTGTVATQGRLVFKDQASAGNSAIELRGLGATLDLSGLASNLPETATGRASVDLSGASAAIVPNDGASFVVNSLISTYRSNPVIHLGGTQLVLGSNNGDIFSLATLEETGGAYGSSTGQPLIGGGLVKRGSGVLQISRQNHYSGQTVVEGGELRLVGGSISRTLVQPAGRLAGYGTINGNLENSFGRVVPGLSDGVFDEFSGPPAVVPGNPIGTLTVQGNFLQQPGTSGGTSSSRSRLSIQIAGANEFDRLAVAGNAALGGTLELSLLNGYAPAGTSSYAFLSAASVTGRFEQFEIGSGWGYLLSPELVYEPTGVSVRIQQKALASVSTAPGLQALGRHLDQTLATSTGEYRDLVVRLNGLPSAAQVSQTLEALSPDRYSVLSEYGFVSALTQQSNLEQHLKAWRSIPNSAPRGGEFYFEASYGRSVFDPVEGGAPSRFRTDGGVVGGAWHHDGWSAGATLGYSTADAKLDLAGSKADVKSIRPALFVQYAPENFFCNASAGFSRDEYELSRHVVFAGFDRTATASPSGRRMDLAVTAGYHVGIGEWVLTPNAGLLHANWKMNDFSESGAAGADLAFSEWSNRSTFSRAGLEISRRTAGRRFRPGASVLWWHDLSDDRSFGARFVGASASYRAPGRPPTGNLIQGRISLDANLGTRAVVSASATGLWGKNLGTTPQFSAGIRWGF